ncbi:hypothetical protein DM01DRAFT_1409403 [Hesseltinella vesiculosa]|uniref:Transcription and mRNA export factor SUS1 n=1 Tax=Hesseltinella vesiculosa TaxID=101127 RepID=A0A1X2GAR9_9FUNG|nr:hypothetical protein DM01DRAFT_1409403 [Hesseltinella vesiculosa]
MATPDDELIAALSRQFVNSGEKQRLLALLKSKLTEANWSDAYYAHCRTAIQDRKDNVTMEELIEMNSDHGRSMISESIKKELLVHIKKFLHDALVNPTPSNEE